MSTASIDSLIWIKTELERTLEAARRCLNAYAEEPENQSLFDEFVRHSHQVTGTFAMLEVRGGRMLGEHIESLARALSEGRVPDDSETCELLMRANLELSDYLDRMISGMRDSPAELRSITNEIRVRLGEEPMERSRMTGRERAPLPTKSSGEDIVSLAARLRPQYQAALLDFFHNRQRQSAIAKMAEVVARLEAAATTPVVFEFLWVAGGLFEALAEGGLVSSLVVNRVLGQFERELKRLATSSEAAVADAPPESLVARMLSELEQTHSSGERVAAVRDTFRLGEAADEAAETHMTTGPGSALLNSAGAAVLEDLARVRDRIDIFVRTGARNPADLGLLVGTLKKVGDALGMLGLDAARQHVEHECEAIRTLAGEAKTDQAALLTLATGLILVESDVEAYLAGSDHDSGSLAGRSARFAGLREALAEISRVKDGFSDYLHGSDPTRLEPLPRMILRLSQTLDFLELAEAAVPMRRIAAYIERIRVAATLPERADLDRLADAVVSVEYYLETLQHGREASASILENADQALRALHVEVDATPEMLHEAEDRPLAGAAPGLAEQDEKALKPDAGAQTVDLEAAVEEGPVEPLSPRKVQEMPASSEMAEAPELPPVRETGADPEIVVVFMEEAREVCETLAAELPAWQSDPGNREVLSVIRRSFHTLKGSGRMVGAQRLGEFAWAYENLLNRVIDYTLPPAEPIVVAVTEAVGALDELLTQFDRDEPPRSDVAELFLRAELLARGEGLEVEDEQDAPDLMEAAEATAEPERDEAALPVEEVVDRAAESELSGQSEPEPEPEPRPTPRLDPVLYGIYRRETEGHLAVVRAWLNELVPGMKASTSRELLRAVHTLEGSASMAGVDEIAALFGPLETVLRRVGEEGIDPTGCLPARLAEAQALGQALLAAYADDSRALPDWEQVAEKMVEFERKVLAMMEDMEEGAHEAAETEESDAWEDAATGSKRTEAEVVPAQPPSGEIPEEPSARIEALAGEKGVDSELAQIFIPEANELLDASDAAAHAWSQNHDLSEPLTELLRRMHTLKGGARMAGVTPLGDLTHELESVLTRVADGRIAVSDDLLHLVERTLDRLHRMVVHLSGDGKIQTDEAIVAELREQAGVGTSVELDAISDEERVDSSSSGGASTATDEESDSAEVDETFSQSEGFEQEEDEAEQGMQKADSAPEAPEAADAAAPQQLPRIRHEMARVRADLLETSINNTGEVSIYRGRIETQLRNMQVHIVELGRTVDRLRDQLRELEMETEAHILSNYEQRPEVEERDFDPLELDRYTRIHELSRSLAEAVSDLTSLRSLFTTELSQANLLLERQGRVNAELQDALMRTRMVPFSLSAPRLRRVVRQVSEEAGKQVNFAIFGSEGEMDRQVVGHILPALEHLIRNAVVHGIERPAVRVSRGKPEIGRLKLELKRDGGDMVIEVTDDGGGLDLEAIRAKAVEEGLVGPDAEPSEAELMALVFRPGFSTSKTVTQAAGRGVGMDVVAAEARQIGGSAEVETTAGVGACCRIRLPATLAITQTLLVRVGQMRYPVALASITSIARLSSAEIDELLASEARSFEYGGKPYELASLATILGEELPPPDERASRQPLLLVNTGGRRVALIAEDMENSREIVVKPVGPQVAGIPGIAGATIFGDGSIGLILDLTALVRGLPQATRMAEMEQPAAPNEARPAALEAPLVLVVDDSITVRRVTQRLLERNGIRVFTAKDGVEALDLLQDNRPDVVLLDIEMPRMDGYELAGHMKNNERLRNIPIIVITSRTGDKHRERANQIGIEHYLGKPYQDVDLMEAVQGFLPHFASVSSAGQGE